MGLSAIASLRALLFWKRRRCVAKLFVVFDAVRFCIPEVVHGIKETIFGPNGVAGFANDEKTDCKCGCP